MDGPTEQVWCLFDGCDLWGVYSTGELAEAAARDAFLVQPPPRFRPAVRVICVQVDAPAESQSE